VTGANSGIGFEAAKTFAALNAVVIIASRDEQKGKAAAEKINETTKSQNAIFIQLDLGSFESVKHFASEFLKRYQRLDILVNNAGLIPPPNKKTVEGFEYGFGVMHLGHFLLTKLLLPTIVKTHQRFDDTRVINVSSAMHHRATEKQFSEFQSSIHNSYARAKLGTQKEI